MIGYLWVVVMFPGTFAPAIKRLGDWYPALFGLIAALIFISFHAIWHMKRWGVVLFIAAVSMKILCEMMVDQVGYIGIFLALFFSISFIPFYKRMDFNF